MVDAEHDSAYSKVMTVTYTGRQPIIIRQPQSNTNATVNEDGTLSGVTLTCEAVSVTKDDSDIEYFWEGYFQEYGHWVQLTLYKPTIEPNYPGLYRCRVYDGNTDQYIYSKVATVSGKMIVQNLYIPYENYYSDIKGSKGYMKTSFKMDIIGGSAPFTIEAYMKGHGGNADVLSDTVVLQREELKELHVYIPQYELINGYAVDGVTPISQAHYAQYYFIITDAYGQSITTDVVQVTSPLSYRYQ